MTAFDFIVTVATGSLLASAGTASEWPNFLQALVAIAALMGLQVILAIYRRSRGRDEQSDRERAADADAGWGVPGSFHGLEPRFPR